MTPRRGFLKQTTYVTAGFLGLQRFLDSSEAAQKYQSEVEKYGKLKDDPRRILDLPKGFSYTVVSKTGDVMDDGLFTPGWPDGMAAFKGPDGRVVVVRNHELEDGWTFQSPFGVTNELLGKIAPEKVYDIGQGKRPQLGGTTNFVYDPKKGKVERSFLSLAGTTRNCAGGPTPWGTWVTCEETVLRPEKDKDGKPKHEFLEKWHGYNFEVPATSKIGLADPIPLKDMGRFNHEAIAVDPKSGIVYQTEDRDNGLITRFIPNQPGKLAEGGKLQALVVKDQKSCDTRSWPDTGNPKFPVGESVAVEWKTIRNVDNRKDNLRAKMHKRGAAIFARGEGMWYGNGRIYFACTSGGIAKQGQIFTYVPSPNEGTAAEEKHPGMLELYLEPNNTQLLQYCDNLTVAPWGDVVISEDGADDQYLRGITPSGHIYTIARNAYHGKSELCGVCFAPNHPTLFVNIQRPGITLAITGPWEKLAKEKAK